MTPEERAGTVYAKYYGEFPSYTEPITDNIAKHIRAALAEEREACARAVEEHVCQHGTICIGSFDVSAAIRARC